MASLQTQDCDYQSIPGEAAASLRVTAMDNGTSPSGAFEGHFSWPDYVIFSSSLAVSLLIGCYFSFVKKSRHAEEVLLGSRNMAIFPTSMSLIASFMSAITLLGVPVEFYQYGTMFAYTSISIVLMLIITSLFYAPVFFRLSYTSVYQYLELRFNIWTRCIASVIFIVQMTMYISIVVYAPALALAQVTGINEYLSSTFIFGICVLYTSLGGMRAVIWTDVLQIFIMFGSIWMVYVKGLVDEGGFLRVWNIAVEGERIEFDNFSISPLVRHGAFPVVIGATVSWLSMYGTNQSQVQRYLCMSSMKKVRRSLMINIVGLIGLMVSCGFGGLIVYARYRHCDPIKARLVSRADQLVPFFVMDVFKDYPGIPGIFLSGVFSGSLSTVSTGINSLAAVTLEDIFRRFFWKNMSERRAGNVSRLLTLVFGAVSFTLIFLAARLGDILQITISFTAVSGVPVLGAFTMGIFLSFVNSWGASLGMISGLCFGAWLITGSFLSSLPKNVKETFIHGCAFNASFPVQDRSNQQPDHVFPLYRVSYMWYSTLCFLVTITVGIAVSLATGKQDHAKLNPNLLLQRSDLDLFCLRSGGKAKAETQGEQISKPFASHLSCVALIPNEENVELGTVNKIFGDADGDLKQRQHTSRDDSSKSGLSSC